ncbi:MAG: ATP-binding protein [Endomicrobiales bacterium]
MALKDDPVLVITGARQVGKSTFLKKDAQFRGWRYITLDDYEVFRQIQTVPEIVWQDTDRIIIDEVQRYPDLLRAIKKTVDEDRLRRRFVLSGSANLLLMSHVSESLAGRAVYTAMHPMTLREMRGCAEENPLAALMAGGLPEGKNIPSAKDIKRFIMRGGMPATLAMSSQESVTQWWEGYVSTYLERDLRQLSQVDSVVDFRTLMRAVALRSGGVVNQADIGRDIKVSQPTVFRYLNLLETSYLLMRVPAYARSKTKRLVKAPKAYYLDTGLAAFLCGIYDDTVSHETREWGALLETLVLQHLITYGESMVPRPDVHYWRTVTGAEIDFIIEQGKHLLAVEVKSSENVSISDARHVLAFLDEFPHAYGVILYGGSAARRLHDRLTAIPMTWFL